MTRGGKLFGADNKIDALNNQLAIFLLYHLTWRCQLAIKVVWKRHQLYVKIVNWRNQALEIKNVQIKSTDKYDYGTFRNCRCASVQTNIVPTGCSYTHVLCGVFCPSIPQNTGFWNLFAKVPQTLQMWASQIKLYCVTIILTVSL